MRQGSDANAMLLAVNEIQGLDPHLAASERFGVICVFFGEACMRLDQVKVEAEKKKKKSILKNCSTDCHRDLRARSQVASAD